MLDNRNDITMNYMTTIFLSSATGNLYDHVFMCGVIAKMLDNTVSSCFYDGEHPHPGPLQTEESPSTNVLGSSFLRERRKVRMYYPFSSQKQKLQKAFFL
jgi:hypothetical protein